MTTFAQLTEAARTFARVRKESELGENCSLALSAEVTIVSRPGFGNPGERAEALKSSSWGAGVATLLTGATIFVSRLLVG